MHSIYIWISRYRLCTGYLTIIFDNQIWFVMVCLWFSLGFSPLWARNLEKHKESYHFGSKMKEILRKTLKSWLAGLSRLETSSPGSPESTPGRLRQASEIISDLVLDHRLGGGPARDECLWTRLWMNSAEGAKGKSRVSKLSGTRNKRFQTLKF